MLQSGPALRTGVQLDVGERMTISVSDTHGSHTANVRCVPSDMASWSAQRDGVPQNPYIVFSPTLTAAGPYSVIADDHGVPVWWIRAPQGSPLDTKVIGDSVIWARGSGGGFGETVYDRVGLDGSAARPSSRRGSTVWTTTT